MCEFLTAVEDYLDDKFEKDVKGRNTIERDRMISLVSRWKRYRDSTTTPFVCTLCSDVSAKPANKNGSKKRKMDQDNLERKKKLFKYARQCNLNDQDIQALLNKGKRVPDILKEQEPKRKRTKHIEKKQRLQEKRNKIKRKALEHFTPLQDCSQKLASKSIEFRNKSNFCVPYSAANLVKLFCDVTGYNDDGAYKTILKTKDELRYGGIGACAQYFISALHQYYEVRGIKTKVMLANLEKYQNGMLLVSLWKQVSTKLVNKKKQKPSPAKHTIGIMGGWIIDSNMDKPVKCSKKALDLVIKKICPTQYEFSHFAKAYYIVPKHKL